MNLTPEHDDAHSQVAPQRNSITRKNLYDYVYLNILFSPLTQKILNMYDLPVMDFFECGLQQILVYLSLT